MKPAMIVTILLFLISCGDNDYEDITNECEFINMFTLNPCFEEPYGEFIFTDRDTFLALVDTMRISSSRFDCDTAIAPNIDFENFVLLGKYASGGGCNIKFKQRVYRDITNQQLIYQIDVKATGWCDMLGYSNNWVLIPKPLFYEDVIFSVDE
jgi:hypothetical protein